MGIGYAVLFIGGALVIGLLVGFFVGKYVEFKKQKIG